MASRHVHVVPKEVPPEIQVRTAVAAGVILLAFAAVVMRLWYLQVAIGTDMRSLSENNRIRLVRVPAARGVVYDRHGEILVDNRPSFDVVFVPEDARRDRRASLRKLAAYLGEEEHTVVEQAKVPSKRPPYEGIVLRKDVDWGGVVALETHQLDLPGVSLQVRPKRFYPRGALAAHLLGYVGEVSERQLAGGAAEDGYQRGDLIGKAGLEQAWDPDIRGEPGGEQVEVDALGRRVRTLQEVPDVAGGTLVLTIDADLQEAAEQAMAEHDGALVALDPRNGEVLAMVSHPAYDPNVFARGIRSEEWNALVRDPKRPLNHRALQGQYPPGSTFKVAVAAGALEQGLGGTGVSCSGGMPFGNHYFRCWKKGGHGPVNLHTGIVQSCDVFFYTVGQRLGIDGIAEYAKRLGLGIPTGIRLEGEKEGTIPSTEWKRRRFKQPWFPGETLSVAIGQGYVTTTPLQMAHMVATLANGGTRWRPFYVKRVLAPDGTVRHEFEPEKLGDAGLQRSTVERVQRAMRDVVMSEGGTGKKARVLGVEVAGKTGTAQVVKLGQDRERSNKGARQTRDHAWFIAFAPLQAPEIAVACIVEHAGGGGGAVAAPVVQEVLNRWFSRDQGPGLPGAQQASVAAEDGRAVRP
jgi:penicillin-binding protein 2